MSEKSESIPIKYNPYEMAEFKHKAEPVREVYQKYKEEAYFPSRFQRDKTAWPEAKKRSYIRNIYYGLIPTSIILTRKSKEENTRYFIEDGLQRLEAIKQFKEGGFYVSLDSKEEGDENKIAQENFYYKATEPDHIHKIFTPAQKTKFNKTKIHIMYSTEVLSAAVRRALFLIIQQGVPVNEYTLTKSTNGNISQIVFDFIKEVTKEDGEIMAEFKAMYKEDLYFKILSDLCVYLNDPDATPESLKSYDDNTIVATDFIESRLKPLGLNFRTFMDIINTYIEPIRFVTALIWYTEMVNKSNYEYTKELKLFKIQIEKLKYEGLSVEWKSTDKYDTHLTYLKYRAKFD